MRLPTLLPLALIPSSALASAIYKPSSLALHQQSFASPPPPDFEMTVKEKWEDSPGTGHLSQWSRQNKVSSLSFNGGERAERGGGRFDEVDEGQGRVEGTRERQRRRGRRYKVSRCYLQGLQYRRRLRNANPPRSRR
jgi:hypothetical protein